jgi:hypothetical protein
VSGSRRDTDPSRRRPATRRGAARARAGAILGTLALALALARVVGAQTAPGYVLNPPGRDTTRQLDAYGMSSLTPTRRRTPTGFLYPEPLEPQTLSEVVGDWLARGAIEIGGEAAFGDTKETRFSQYADWSNDFLLNSFSVGLLHPESGFHVDARGGGVGRNDDYYSGEIGWPARFRLRGTWSGIPHTYAKDAHNLFRGAGSEVLKIPDPPLTPGDNADDAVRNVLTGIGTSTLATQRNDLGLFADAWLRPDLELFASYQRKAREGTRPFGGALVYATGLTGGLARAIETTQPIHDEIHNLSSGLEFRKDWILGRLSYNGSFYTDHDDTLTWESPFRVQPAGARGSSNVERGRFALAPDNSWINLKGDLALDVPLDGRFTTTFSWSRMYQDDDLIPPTVNSGIVGGSLNEVNLDLWNTEAALARRTGKAEVFTLLVNGDLRFRPWKRLRLGARVRYYDRDNQTRYTALNGSTGQIGYIAEDGALAVGTPQFNRVFEPGRPSDDWRYRSTPYAYDQIKVEGSADYALKPKTSVGLLYTWQQLGYQHRERDRTEENRIRAYVTSRQISWATVRLSYEYGGRGGSPYDPDPYGRYYVSSLPGFTPFRDPLPPFTLPGLRKYDLADRRQHLANLRVNFLVGEFMDLSVTASYRDDDYDVDYGLDNDRRGSVNLEWHLQPSPKFGINLWGTYEQGRSKMATVNDQGFSFPPENAWSQRTRETGGAAGLGLWARPFAHVSVETNYVFILNTQQLDYDYRSDGALPPGITSAEAGNHFPDLRTEDQVLQTSLRLELTEQVALRVFHRYEYSTIDDFQQTGLDSEADAGVIGGAYYLRHVDRDYDAHVVGATLQLRF